MELKYKKRLLALADFLDKLPRKRFDFGAWVGEDWKGKPDLSCGTTACAMGWATTMPRFRRLGLRLSDSEPVILRSNSPFDYEQGASEAIEEIFGPEAYRRRLFYPRTAGGVLANPDSYSNLPGDATPKQVAKSIRKFVREYSR